MNRIILICCAVAAIGPVEGQKLSTDGCYGAACNPDIYTIDRQLSALQAAARALDQTAGNQVVKGKPFSATEERHSLQVLGDGTRIENTETNRLYRDAEGRTRVEDMNGKITINDPVGRLTMELDPATKTARKSGGGNGGGGVRFSAKAVFQTDFGTPFTFTSVQSPQPNASAMKGVMAETTENLGSQSVNGVTAQGIRNTMTIPKGQIGNSKDIKVITERWTSGDLQMLVKSVNSDPRFGDTTYQLTKVTQSAPDPALFQIPADYTVDQAPALRAVAPAARAVGRAPQPAVRAAPPAAPVPALPPLPAK